MHLTEIPLMGQPTGRAVVLAICLTLACFGLIVLMASTAQRKHLAGLHRFCQFLLAGLLLGASSAFANVIQMILGKEVGIALGLLLGGLVAGLITALFDVIAHALEVLTPHHLTSLGMLFLGGGLLGALSDIALLVAGGRLP